VNYIRAGVDDKPIVKRGSYRYFSCEIADQVPLITSEMLWEATHELLKLLQTRDFDKIVTAEAQGVPFATAISMMTGKPLCIARKNNRRFDKSEVEIPFECGYESGKLFLYGVGKGDRVVIIDDTISTGGTVVALWRGMKGIGATVVDVLTVVEKPEYKGCDIIEKKTGVRPKAVVRVSVKGKRTKVID